MSWTFKEQIKIFEMALTRVCIVKVDYEMDTLL